jgi:O-acetyl-ADP-ribose deacetylase (regulator of RNase III)
MELNEACQKYNVPLKDGDAVITQAFNIGNAKYIIHAVGPDFGCTSDAFNELFDAYFNSLKVLKENGLHSISFPIISSGIFGGSLENPVAVSIKQCINAYHKFIETYKDYEIDVIICAFTSDEMHKAEKIFEEEGM